MNIELGRKHINLTWKQSTLKCKILIFLDSFQRLSFVEHFVEPRGIRDNENDVSSITLYEHDWEDENLNRLIRINQNKCYNGSAGQTEGVCREAKSKEYQKTGSMWTKSQSSQVSRYQVKSWGKEFLSYSWRKCPANNKFKTCC